MKRPPEAVAPSGEGAGTDQPSASEMTVENVMTGPVVVVHTDETFCGIANLLRRHRISGLPVVDDDGRPVGLVSESDLIRRLVRAERQRVFADQTPAPISRAQSRATAETAGGLMSQPAISTTPQASTDEALGLMRRRAVRRLPVINDEGRVVGILTRTDLLQPYACTDQQLREKLCGVMQRLGIDSRSIRLDVEDGNVLMVGTLANRELVAQLEETARDTPGVVRVESRLRGRRPPHLP